MLRDHWGEKNPTLLDFSLYSTSEKREIVSMHTSAIHVQIHDRHLACLSIKAEKLASEFLPAFTDRTNHSDMAAAQPSCSSQAIRLSGGRHHRSLILFLSLHHASIQQLLHTSLLGQHEKPHYGMSRILQYLHKLLWSCSRSKMKINITNIQWALVLRVEMPCWSSSEENILITSNQQEVNRHWNNLS